LPVANIFAVLQVAILLNQSAGFGIKM